MANSRERKGAMWPACAFLEVGTPLASATLATTDRRTLRTEATRPHQTLLH
jgi:hypothetical protein